MDAATALAKVCWNCILDHNTCIWSLSIARVCSSATSATTINAVHEPKDPEYSILKQRLARRMRHEGLCEDDVQRLT